MMLFMNKTLRHAPMCYSCPHLLVAHVRRRLLTTMTATTTATATRTIRTSSSLSQPSLPSSSSIAHKSSNSVASPPLRTTKTTTTNVSQPIDYLFISNVLPDPSASAAGVRTQSLMKLLSSSGQNTTIGYATTTNPIPHNKDDGNDNHEEGEDKAAMKSPNTLTTSTKVEYTSPETIISSSSDDSSSSSNIADNVEYFHLPANRSNIANEFFAQEHHSNISTIIYDRFYMEETFSHSVQQQHLPEACHILDMQDMHSLRWGRQQLVQDFDKNYPDTCDPFECLDDVVAFQPSILTIPGNNRLLRELASIQRCDLTLVCSPYELEVLQSTYNIPSNKLCLAPFFVDQSSIQKSRKPPLDYEDTNRDTRFIFCGGFKHAPNVDAVHVLVNHIWPKIHCQLATEATLHIYGAYCNSKIYKYHNPANGIYVHGYTSSLDDVFSNHGNNRVLLAPLRFGAGIKGKIVDAWTYGIPVVTTPIGSDGMVIPKKNYDETSVQYSVFGGRVSFTVNEFVDAAVELAMDPAAAAQAIEDGTSCLKTLYDYDQNGQSVVNKIHEVQRNLSKRRETDITRAILWHQSNRSTEYFSKWIELKETMYPKQPK